MTIALIIVPGVHAQTVSGPLPGTPTMGQGALALAPSSYVVEEYFLSGTAKSYQRVDEATPGASWRVEPAETASYKTRMVVVRPANPDQFNGTVLVEWLNVTAGTDGAPDWIYLHRELVRNGYAWVGVSAQKAGIDGSPMGIPGLPPLKKADPQRYADLNHPGDPYSFDIFSQAAEVIRSTEGGVLGPLEAERLLASGESQSAAYLTTYVNGIHPRDRAFDGYLIHSRFKGSAPFESDYLSSMQARRGNLAVDSVEIRSDLDVPVLMVITETDLMAPMVGYLEARQEETPLIRVWEVAGTAHADTYTLSAGYIDDRTAPITALADAYAATDNILGQQLPKPINSAPQHHYVMQAALDALNTWVKEGVAPPVAEPLQTSASEPATLVLDQNGNAKGGIRSPWVDAPTAKLSGLGQPGGGLASLFGSTEPYDSARLAELYPGGKAEYLDKFRAALRDAIDAGFILAADRMEIEALAEAMYPQK